MTVPLIAALTLGRRVQQRTQKEVAASAGIPARTLSDWERGVIIPRASGVFTLADALNHLIVLRAGDQCRLCGHATGAGGGVPVLDVASLMAAVRRIRLTLNLTCAQAAELGGVCRASVERWEGGLVDPGVLDLDDYIRGLGFSLAAEPIPTAVAS